MINSFYEWLQIKGQHQDNFVEIKLTNLKKRIDGSTLFEDVKVEWDAASLMNELGSLFKEVPFFLVSDSEFHSAAGAMDNFIRDYYQNTPELEAYLSPADKIPEDIEKTFLSSEMRRPFWNVLLAVNQSKMSNCKILEKPIPGVGEDLNIGIWSGAKVKSPFLTELNENFRTIILRGKRKAIDDFIEVYKMTKQGIKI